MLMTDVEHNGAIRDKLSPLKNLLLGLTSFNVQFLDHEENYFMPIVTKQFQRYTCSISYGFSNASV